MPWRGPGYEGEVPTLGWDILDWMGEYLVVPDGPAAGEPLELTPEQAQFILNFYKVDPKFRGSAVAGRALRNARLINRAILARSKGWGKAEALDNEVPTPTGWKQIRDVRLGDELFGGDGRIVRVAAVHPVTWVDAYRVTFSDGSSAVFSGDHLFDVDEFTGTHVRTRRTFTVRAMAAKGLTFKRPLTRGKTKASTGGVSRFALPQQPVLDGPDLELPVDPYVLGYWLGDGDSDTTRITCGAEDLTQLVGELEMAGQMVGRVAKTNTAFRVSLTGARPAFQSLGLLNDKHIPPTYLRASAWQRLALLQGLMDSDGTIEKTGRAEFSVVNQRLAEHVAELMRTLGIRVNLRANNATLNGRVVGTRYRLSFTPPAGLPVFRLPRKAARLKVPTGRRPFPRVISSIEPAPDQPMRCITVDSPDGLYVTGRNMVTTHNSPILGALGIVEALGDVILDGWDANGEPVARPWTSLGFKAKVQILAVSEDQTENTWSPLLDMITGSPSLIDDYQLDPKETFVSGPRMRLEYATSAGDSREGGRPVACLLDQTESWRRSNGGTKLAAAVRRNLTKTQGVSIESPNAYIPGDGSVAEASFKAAELQIKRAARPGSLYRPTILLDHRGAPPDVDIYDTKALKKALAVAYGDSADVNGGWVNLDRVVEDFWDPDSTIEDSRRFFLNQITAAADSWLSELEVDGVNVLVQDDLGVPGIAAGEMITMGFDGSRGRKKGVTDSTALIGCRVSDGHLFEIGVWEQPKEWPKTKVWAPPVAEVVAAVAKAFTTYKVVGFYGDPAKWESYFAKWEARYGKQLLAKVSGPHPCSWWLGGQRSGRTIAAFRTFHDAVTEHAVTFDGSISIRRHLLNARMVIRAGGIWIEKKHPDSEDKIDAAIAAVLAYQARLDAIAAGALKKPRRRAPVRRIR